MKSHNSCQKLIGVEEGIIWSDEANPKKLITIWKREEYLTKCMKILSTCLAIVLVVLIFYHFRLSFMELESTRKTIDSLERLQSEEMSAIANNDVNLDEGKVDPKTRKDSAMTTEEINVASIEGISSPPKLKFSFDLDDASPTYMPYIPTLSETEDHEISEASNGIEERILKIFKLAGETETTTSNVIFCNLVEFENLRPEEQEITEEVDSESTTTENVIKIIENMDQQETHPKVVNYDDDDEYYDYLDYSSYTYDSRNEDSGDADSTERIPTFSIPEESEEAPKFAIDFSSIIPVSASLSFKLNRTLTNDDDIDGTGVTEGMGNESSKQDDDAASMNDFVDEYFRNLEAKRLAEVEKLVEATRSADNDNYAWYEILWPENDIVDPDTWKDEDSEIVSISSSEKNTTQDTPSEDSSTIEPSSTPSEKKDSQGVDEVTVNPATSSESMEISYEMIDDLLDNSFLNDFIRLLCEPLYYLTSEEIDLLSDEMTESEESTINECFSLRKKDSTDNTNSTKSDDKDSQQIDKVTVDFESSKKSSKDSHETIDSLDDINVDDWFDEVKQVLCNTLFDIQYQSIDSTSDILSESDIFTAMECLPMKNGASDDAIERLFLRKRSIADESIHEKIGDHRSASKAAQIMTVMQRVIQQDEQFLKDEESKISNPVVKSKVEDYFKKMEAVSAHIDQLQELYLIKNELNDDYVSREFPPQA